MPKTKNLSALKEKVIDKDLCTMCGACASLCPYIRTHKGRVIPLHDCDLEDGRCYDYCPRTEVDLMGIHRDVFVKDYSEAEIEIGPFRSILMARAAEQSFRNRAQSGGVVSALLDHAIQASFINAAVLTQWGKDLLPEGVIARNGEAILKSAGSNYIAAPTLEALNRLPLGEVERVGVVGLPCQVLALRKMKASQKHKRTPIDNIALVLGLFCMWALKYEAFEIFLRKCLNNLSIRHFEITPPPERLLKVTTDEKIVDIPLDDIRPFIRPTCGICFDMTSEFADISLGTVEGVERWNTLIIRTERGEQLLSRAKEKGLIETLSLPEDKKTHLKEASLLKKRRALNALKDRDESENPYLILPKKLIKTILSDEREGH